MRIEDIVFIAIYVPSLIISWYLTRCYLLKYGYQRASISDMLFVLLPLANTIICCLYYSELEIRFKFNTIKFFFIKKVSK